jgi:hypothetical protein
MMGLGVEVKIDVSGLTLHFVSERAIRSSVNIQVQECEVAFTFDFHGELNGLMDATLIHRARAFCDEDSLQAELVFLMDVLKQNGYNDRQIHRVSTTVSTYLNRTTSPTQSPSCPLSELYSIV